MKCSVYFYTKKIISFLFFFHTSITLHFLSIKIGCILFLLEIIL